MAGDIGHNSGAAVQDFVDRLERLDEERRALAGDLKDLLEKAASSTGFAKASFRNLLRERRKSRGEVHATYVELAAMRRALGMRDPLEPPDEDEEPGTLASVTASEPGQGEDTGGATESAGAPRASPAFLQAGEVIEATFGELVAARERRRLRDAVRSPEEAAP